MPFFQIARNKLHRPRIIGDFVTRSDLVARLEAGSSLPLTLLAAPAGYGKTSLVAHWLEGREGRVAWLSLDVDDSEPAAFARCVAAAIRTVFPEACADTLACLDLAQAPSLMALSVCLSNDLEALTAPLILVLDDYHRIDSLPTHLLVDRLLARPVPHLHLVVISRNNPPLALGALRVREELNEITMLELRFAKAKTATLLERGAGRVVAEEALDHLHEWTEGWPAGVRLAALALRYNAGFDQPGHRRNGGMAQVEQYFLEEVFSQQTEGVRHCLLRTSILERFSGPLCDALADSRAEDADHLDGEAFMHFVSSGSVLCMPTDDSLRWYRYHRMFREFLQWQLARLYPEQAIGEMHGRAAAWLAGQGLLEEAILHALAGAGPEAAGQMVAVQRNLLIRREQRHRLNRLLSLLPADTIESDAELLLLKAWLMHHQGRQVETPPVLDRIEVLLAHAAADLPSSRLLPLRGGVLALRSLQHYRDGRVDLAVSAAGQALECLPADCVDDLVVAQAVVGGARQMAGDLAGARQWLHDCLAHAPGPVERCQAPLAAALGFIDWMAGDLSALFWRASQHYSGAGGSHLGSAGEVGLGAYFHGLVQYQRNELALAEATLSCAASPVHAPSLGYRTEVSFVLAAVYQAQGQADRAREIIDEICQELWRKADSPALFRAQACQAELALRQGRLDQAREWARSFDPGPVHFAYHFSSAPHLTLTKVWIAEGNADSREQAARLLQLLEAQLTARHNVRFLVEVLALQALLQHGLGDEAAASEQLGRAVLLAQPGGFIRLFVDLGQELVQPLKRLTPDKATAHYVGQILSAFNDDWLVTAGRQQVGADLTRRELKILKLLAVRLSNVEISEELCISRATVKRHTQNIYRKLRASSRREAVVRARTLNILVDG